MVDVGTGTTIAFGTSNYSANVTNIAFDSAEVPVLEASHFGTTNYKQKIFGRLKEPPKLTCELLFDPDSPPPVGKESETITITFPVPSGKTNGATLSGSGQIISTSITVPLDDVMTGQYVIQFDGKTETTWAKAS